MSVVVVKWAGIGEFLLSERKRERERERVHTHAHALARLKRWRERKKENERERSNAKESAYVREAQVGKLDVSTLI